MTETLKMVVEKFDNKEKIMFAYFELTFTRPFDLVDRDILLCHDLLIYCF